MQCVGLTYLVLYKHMEEVLVGAASMEFEKWGRKD